MGESRPIACSKKGAQERKHLLNESLESRVKMDQKNKTTTIATQTTQKRKTKQNKEGGFAYALKAERILGFLYTL